MNVVRNLALDAFVAEMGEECVLAEVLVRRVGSGFELRHVGDREMAKDAMTNVQGILNDKSLKELREVAQLTEGGEFRALKSAPNLRRGWRAVVRDVEELGLALNFLYPGAVADWFAVKAGRGVVTNYREFTGRQTGMYRVTAMLSDERAGEVARVCCDRRLCLKRRLWTVAGLAVDDGEGKSVIPCLEPCAILLEFARKAMRAEQASS